MNITAFPGIKNLTIEYFNYFQLVIIISSLKELNSGMYIKYTFSWKNTQFFKKKFERLQTFTNGDDCSCFVGYNIIIERNRYLVFSA